EIGETLGIVGDENITTTAGNGEIEVALNKDIDLGSDGSVKTGNTFIDNDGLTITGGPSITIDGIHAGDKKITGVAPGVDGTDAVNVSQLEQQETALTNKGLKFSANDGADVHRNLGQTLAITGSAVTTGNYVGDNIKTSTNSSGGIDILMAETPSFKGADMGDEKITNVADGTNSSDRSE